MIQFPQLYQLPAGMVFMGAVGLAHGYLTGVSKKVAICAFMCIALAQTILFALANPFFGGDLGEKSLKVFLVTSLIATTCCTYAFRKLNIIAKLGTCVMIAWTAANLILNVKAIRNLQVPPAS